VVNNLNNKKIDIYVTRFINTNKKGNAPKVEKLSENQLTKTDLELIEKIKKRSHDFYSDCFEEKKEEKKYRAYSLKLEKKRVNKKEKKQNDGQITEKEISNDLKHIHRRNKTRSLISKLNCLGGINKTLTCNT